MKLIKAEVTRLVHFILEREAVRVRKESGQPKPWTKDEMLLRYRFCNVRREDDVVTRWIAREWRDGFFNPYLWFAMCVARLVNWPDTLRELRYPVPWDGKRFVKVLKDRAKRGEKVWTGAYMVSTNGRTASKPVYIASHVLGPLWKVREGINSVYTNGADLGAFHALLMRYEGMGSFMAAQVVADLKYVEPLRSASDWMTWAASGPGSRRGLNIIVGRDVSEPWCEVEWWETLHKLQEEINPRLTPMESLHAQDLQNCLCELSKYVRGYSRSKYPGNA